MKTNKPVFNPDSHPEMTPQEYSLYHRRAYQKWYRTTHEKTPGSVEARREYQKKWYHAHKAKKAGAWIAPALTPEAAERRREYQRRWRLAQKTKKARQNNGGVEPVALNTCPCCGSRFYVAKGSV